MFSRTHNPASVARASRINHLIHLIEETGTGGIDPQALINRFDLDGLAFPKRTMEYIEVAKGAGRIIEISEKLYSLEGAPKVDKEQQTLTACVYVSQEDGVGI